MFMADGADHPVNDERFAKDEGGARHTCPTCSGDASAARAERQMFMLKALADYGMSVVQSVSQRASASLDGGFAPSVGVDLARAYERVARSIRQTIALEARIDRELNHPETVRCGKAERAPAERRKDEVKAIVSSVVPYRDANPARDREYLLADMYERLDDMAEDEDFDSRPMAQIIADVCETLGVEPDWALWKDEGWELEAPAPATSQTPPHVVGRRAKEPLNSVSSLTCGGSPAKPGWGHSPAADVTPDTPDKPEHWLTAVLRPPPDPAPPPPPFKMPEVMPKTVKEMNALLKTFRPELRRLIRMHAQ